MNDLEYINEHLVELKRKLDQKKSQLSKAKQSLTNARKRLKRLKTIVAFQRERILALYRER